MGCTVTEVNTLEKKNNIKMHFVVEKDHLIQNTAFLINKTK